MRSITSISKTLKQALESLSFLGAIFASLAQMRLQQEMALNPTAAELLKNLPEAGIEEQGKTLPFSKENWELDDEWFFSPSTRMAS